jgi:hypothetical protein
MKRYSLALALLLVLSACGSDTEAPPAMLTTGPTITPTGSPTGPATPSPSAPVPVPATTEARTAAPVTRTAAPEPARTPSSVVGGASVGGCPLFPADNPWRRDVSKDAVDPRSGDYIDSMMEGGNHLHPDFGSNPDYGIPYVVVPKSQKKVPITFTDYGDESDPGPYPVPLDAPVESGGDHHVLVAQQETCKLYELFNARRSGSGWAASSGAVFDLRSNALRPAGWTSADAAGLPILPGLVRRDEITAGAIKHALRFTASRTQRGYVDPARHFASSDTDAKLPPMGLRLRLKKSYDISRFTGPAKIILVALKTYGMILADNGSSFFVSGASDAGWDDDNLDELKTVPGTAFEVVKHGTIHR